VQEKVGVMSEKYIYFFYFTYVLCVILSYALSSICPCIVLYVTPEVFISRATTSTDLSTGYR
jgi:hypothetical protein